MVDAELAAADGRLGQLETHRRAIETLLASPDEPLPLGPAVASLASTVLGSPAGEAPLGIKPRLGLAAVLYAKQGAAAHDALFKSAMTLQAARAELLRYTQAGGGGDAGGASVGGGGGGGGGGGAGGGGGTEAMEVVETEAGGTSTSTEHPPVVVPNLRFDSASALVLETLALFERLAAKPALRDALLDRGLLAELLTANLTNVPRRTQASATRLLCLLSLGSAPATGQLTASLGSRLELLVAAHGSLPHDKLLEPEVALLCELCAMHDEHWPARLALLFRALGRGLEHLGSALLCRRLLLPCLRVVVGIVGAAPPAAETIDFSPMALDFSSPPAEPPPALDFGAWLCDPRAAFAAWERSSTAEPLSRAEALALRFGRRWRARAAGRPPPGGDGGGGGGAAPSSSNWLCELLLCAPCQPVREAGATLLLRVCAETGDGADPALDLLSEMVSRYLPLAVEAGGATSVEFFEALSTLLVSERRRLFLVARVPY